MERIFTYGTLQDPVIQEAVLGHTMQGQPDSLSGFRMSTIGFGRETYPIIIPDSVGTITGIVYEVTPEELVLLDHYETSVYRRIQVTLASGLESWVYCQ
ncbi:MAG: gamma-glutamylcyclotransferase [Anaerolineaceae bacterium]|nr:gamma-glutamylcyclotransferase [Anaerolineaceae bacterium]